MKFDIKDLKSWSNSQDAKVGDEGYFSNSIRGLRKSNIDEAHRSKIRFIDDNWGGCFVSDLNDLNYAFFLPLEAVKEDKPKKKYQSFKDLYEFYKFLSIAPFARKDFCRNMLLKFSFTYREKNAQQCATTTMINRIDVISDPCLCLINNRDFKDWFDNYEIMNNKGEWQSFGVEVKDE